MGMSIERNSSDSYTLEFEKIGSSEKISLSVYDDDRDLVLFANGSNLADVEKALSFLAMPSHYFNRHPN